MMGYLAITAQSCRLRAMGVAKARCGRTAQGAPVLESASEQILWAGAAAGYTPWRSSCRAVHRGWNKGRGPSPSCSTGRVMN